MTVLYVDVSFHDRNRRQAPLDWAAIRAATSPVMCARATYGDPAGYHWDSPYFAEFQAGARSNGFQARGGYHNLVRGDAASIARQVDWHRRTLDSTGANWAMLDVEPYAELVSAGMWPRWEDVLRWQDRWYAVESRVCAWYIPQWFWSAYRTGPNLGSPDLRVLKGPLVQSHYAGGDGTAGQIYANAGGDAGTGWDDVYGNRYPQIWQYTSSADVPGATSATDVNAWRGTLDQLVSLLTGDDDMGMDWNAAWIGQGIAEMKDPVVVPPTEGYAGGSVPNKLAQAVRALATDVAALKARPQVEAAPVDPATLAAALSDPTVLAAIAKAVADENARRQQA